MRNGEKKNLNDMLVSSVDERDQACADDEDEDDDEVRKLKVCIELKGLRLSKPAAGAASPDASQTKQERAWPQAQLAAPIQSLRERKIRAGEPEDRAATQRADINRKWGCEKLLNGENEPAVRRNAGAFLSSARVTETRLWLTLHFLVERSVLWGGFPARLQGGCGGNKVGDVSSC